MYVFMYVERDREMDACMKGIVDHLYRASLILFSWTITELRFTMNDA